MTTYIDYWNYDPNHSSKVKTHVIHCVAVYGYNFYLYLFSLFLKRKDIMTTIRGKIKDFIKSNSPSNKNIIALKTKAAIT